MNILADLQHHIIVFIVMFSMAIVLGPLFIPLLRKLKFGQTVRDDGPQSHLIKTGTPTMGGIIFLIPLLLVGVVYSMYDHRILPLILVTVLFGAVGFVDDLIKVLRKSKDGLSAKQKMFLLLVVSSAFSYYVMKTGIGSDLYIPFLGDRYQIELGWFFIPFSVLVLISASNSVNITDGLDGLAAGVTLIILVFFSVISMIRLEWDYITVFSAALAGGCLGFLLFNLHPAKVFMGDTGSLALGGAVGAIAIFMKLPLLLFLIGFIYVIESLSVILQVASFKLRGKRMFKMAPIHHHLELSGWSETKVVQAFWIITLFLCMLGVFALRINPFQAF